MTRQIIFLGVLVLIWPGLAPAAETGGTVESVRFATSVTAPVFVVPKALREHEPLLRAGLRKMPEGLLVGGALAVGSDGLGLSPRQATDLTSLMTDVYGKINSDPAFQKTPSALPYCFSATKHATGHYFLYRPEEIPQDPTCIVFLLSKQEETFRAIRPFMKRKAVPNR